MGGELNEVLRLVAAAAVGVAIGLNRELRDKRSACARWLWRHESR